MNALKDLIRERLQTIVDGLPPSDRLRGIEWLERAVSSDDQMHRDLLELMLNGRATMMTCPDDPDGPRFKLTPAGQDLALEVIHQSPEARAMFGRLSERSIVDPPKDPQ